MGNAWVTDMTDFADAREPAAGRLELEFAARGARPAMLHGHCHQKAFGVMDGIEKTLDLVPGLSLRTIESGCCGMAGAFGFHADTSAVSRQMAELDLAPAVRAAAESTWIIADGTSCRQQIRDLTGREAVHTARVLASALSG